MPKPITPSLAVDIIAFVGDTRKVVLIRRKNPPYGLALPGGFVNVGEACYAAAHREGMEEISVDIQLIAQLHKL